MSSVKRYLVTRGSEVSEMVYASDYDRDTQALKDELDNIKRSWGLILSQRDALAAERSWAETELPKWRDLAKETRIERDELRAQVEAMRSALENAAKGILWLQASIPMSIRISKRASKDYSAAKRAALQAKP